MAQQQMHSGREIQVPVVFADPVNGRGAMFDASAAASALPQLREILRAEGESRGAVVNEAYFDRAITYMLRGVESQYQDWLERDDGTAGFVADFELPGGAVITMAKPEMLMMINAQMDVTQAPKAQAPSEGFRAP